MKNRIPSSWFSFTVIFGFLSSGFSRCESSRFLGTKFQNRPSAILPLPARFFVPSGYGNNIHVTQEATNDPQRQDLYRGDWNISNTWRATGKYIFYQRNPILPYGSFVLSTPIPALFYGRMQDLGTGPVLLAPPTLVAFDHEGKVPTTYAFNLGIQYKLPFQSVLDLSYVGTTGAHLLQRRSLNAPAYGAAYLAQNQDPTSTGSADIPGARALPVDFLRPYQGFGQIQYIEPASSSNYHALQASLNRRSMTARFCGKLHLLLHTCSGTRAVIDGAYS